MCGIAGFVGLGSAADLKAMADAIVHRGPDGEGFFADQHLPVYLASRRLSVVDLPGGAQPMWDGAGDICVVFNGEIYNHRALRQELEARGHKFLTDHSDTEVLVYGYKEWGEGLFLRLNGMFGLAIYDRHRKTLVLARDRFGEKPLFYGTKAGAFAFASEITALRKHPAYQAASPAKLSLMKFFAHGFFPGEHTPYAQIAKLPAGHMMVVNAATGAREIKCYWSFAIDRDAPAGDARDWTVELEHRLRKAVMLRLQSDVPLGLFLSGGIDSSAVLSFASDVRPAHTIETFSIGFREKTYDESPFAARVAAHVGSRHRNQICDLEAARTTLPSLLSGMDEPLGDSSLLPTSLLCAFARKHVTVALSGDGGDELFAGYDPFKMIQRAELYDRLMPKPVHTAVRLMAARLPLSDTNMSLDFIANRGLMGLKRRAGLRNPAWLAPLQPDEIADIFQTPVGEEELYSEVIAAWDGSRATHAVDRAMEFYTRFYLADDILVKTDRASMRVSLEARAPFLDNELVDYVRRLPWQVKLRGNVASGHTTKWILKRALAGRLPADILARKKKGFGIPLSAWLREWAPPEMSVPFVNDLAMRVRWEMHKSRKRDDRRALWCWLALAYGMGPDRAFPNIG
ncbi:MAG: asparagine synthase (glutamine-hydrolyzing) [Rhodospirillaceae bacterium]